MIILNLLRTWTVVRDPNFDELAPPDIPFAPYSSPKYTHGGNVKRKVRTDFTSTYQRGAWRTQPPEIRNINIGITVSAEEDCATLTVNSDEIKYLTEKVENFALNIEGRRRQWNYRDSFLERYYCG